MGRDHERALLIIDPQVDFCPGGALAIPDGDATIPVINRLSAQYETIVITQDWHPPKHKSFATTHGLPPFSTLPADSPEAASGMIGTLWPDHCVQHTQGANFHPDLDTQRARMILRKGFRPTCDSYSAFVENDRKTPTGLAGFLRDIGIEAIDLCGLALDCCVAWSAEDGIKLGFQTRILTDACRAINPDAEEQLFAGFRDQGIVLIDAAA